MKRTEVKTKDLLRCALAAGHHGDCGGEIEPLTDEEFTYTEFLSDIDAIISGQRVPYEYGIDPKKLKGKNEDEIRGYIQAKIDDVVDYYLAKVQEAIKKGYFVIDKRKDSDHSIYSMQHLLRVSGYAIKTSGNVTTKQVFGNINRPTVAQIPICKINERINESALRESIINKTEHGNAYIEGTIKAILTKKTGR